MEFRRLPTCQTFLLGFTSDPRGCKTMRSLGLPALLMSCLGLALGSHCVQARRPSTPRLRLASDLNHSPCVTFAARTTRWPISRTVRSS